MQSEFENDNLLKINMQKDYSIISNIEDIILDNNSQTSDNVEKNIIKKFLSDKNSKNISKKEKYLYIIELLSKSKLYLKHNCTHDIFNKITAGILIDNADCHLVAIFKEKMLMDYLEEFLRRIYKTKESKERIPKFSKYYRNYLKFFCKPVFKDFRINKIINRNGEKNAEIYYKNNYQGGKSKEDDENNGFAKSSSSEEDVGEKDNKKNKENIENLNNLAQIFDDSIKEKIENATIMTSINSSQNNTINLKIDNEKIEVFSENKCDKSNDTTLHDIMDIIKIKKNNKNHLDDLFKLKKEIIQLDDKNNNNSLNNITDGNNIKNNIDNIYKNLNKNTETNNISNNIKNINKDNMINMNNNKIALKLSQKLNTNNLNKIIKDSIKKIIQNTHLNNKNNIKKNNINKNELKINISPSFKNKSLSKNKKDIYNKNIIINNSDILTIKKTTNNNKNKNKNNINRSRNKNIGFLYKQTYTNYNNYNPNNYNGNNINLKNAKFTSSTLHKINNKIHFNNNIYTSINNLNYPLRYNNKIINNLPISRNNNKYYISNTSLENKAISMKMLDTYTGHNNDREYKNKNILKLSQNNLAYKLSRQNNNNFFNNNYNNMNKFTESINSNNKSNINNDILISNNIKDNNIQNKITDNISNTKCRQQHYNSLAKKIKNKGAISGTKKNKSIDPTHIVGQILYEGNSSTSNKTFNINNNNNMNKMNNTNYSKIINNNIHQLNHNSLKEFKKYYNYNNINNNYNININNQITINANINNHSYNNNLKEFINSNINKKDYDLFKLYKGKNFFKTEKKNPSEDFGSNNLKKYKTRNITSDLNKYYSNPTNNESRNQTKNSLGLNNKIIKSYHNKKYSGITNFLNDKKRLILLKKTSKK